MGFSLSYIFLLLFPFRESPSIIPLGYIQYCWNSSFCLSEKFFISSSNLAGKHILGGTFFPFSPVNILCHSFLAAESLTRNLM